MDIRPLWSYRTETQLTVIKAWWIVGANGTYPPQSNKIFKAFCCNKHKSSVYSWWFLTTALNLEGLKMYMETAFSPRMFCVYLSSRREIRAVLLATSFLSFFIGLRHIMSSPLSSRSSLGGKKHLHWVWNLTTKGVIVLDLYNIKYLSCFILVFILILLNPLWLWVLFSDNRAPCASARWNKKRHLTSFLLMGPLIFGLFCSNNTLKYFYNPSYVNYAWEAN